MPTERPRDECPYRKPFADGFDGCPAFQQSQFVPLDTQYRTLDSIWTCGNLDLGRVPGAPWRHFARCRIGDEQARMAWVREVREDRLAVARSMQRELTPLMADFVTELWAIKGRQLAAPAGTEEYAAATSELLRGGNAFLTMMERFMEERSEDMSRLGMPIDATVDLFREIVYRWVDQPNAEIPVISEASLARFPEEARALLMPESAA
ncbi:MAG TPA: hypothetical protein VFC09_08050 [Candidatus Dormibacteraeota bacterium]|nr:hypothetical protein [Candidatus Dormibacteraeota bacterium]